MEAKAKKRPLKTDNKQKDQENWWIRGTSETADFFGVTDQTILDWVKRGAPKIERGKYDVKAIVRWRQGGNGELSDEARKLKADATIKEHKAAQEEIKLGEIQQKYISAEQVTSDLRRLFLSIKRDMLTIGRQVSIELAAIDQDCARKAERVVNDVVHECLLRLAGHDKYKKSKRK